MGRLLRLLGCSAVAAACVAVALAAAGPGSARSAIPCPLEPAQPITTPCCGPPVLAAKDARPAVFPPCCICCGPVPVAHPTLIVCLPLTISSSPDPSIAGHTVTISGRWSAGTAGVTVVLWQKLPGAKTFKQIGTTTTGAGGDFQFVRTGLETNRQWYVSAMGDNSFTIDQRVRADVTVSMTLHGNRAKFAGRVTPSHAGEHVVVQESAAKRWTVAARPLLDHASRYSIDLPVTVNLRVILPADKRNVRSVSPSVGIQSVY
jgi:hypothetical protein